MNTAGILYQDKFKDSARYAMSYLKSKDLSVLSLPLKQFQSVDHLPRFPDKVDLMVWYSHGGWDGPYIFEGGNLQDPLNSQVSPSEPEEWVQLMTYFKLQLHPGDIFVAHSCHSAGSDWREKKRDKRLGLPEEDRVWVRDIAKHMDIYAFGQAGSAGAAHIPTVKAMLAFIFTGKASGYPFKAYAPGGVHITPESEEWPQFYISHSHK